MKNLMISTESIIEILRLSPQNDITTQSLGREGKGDPDFGDSDLFEVWCFGFGDYLFRYANFFRYSSMRFIPSSIFSMELA